MHNHHTKRMKKTILIFHLSRHKKNMLTERFKKLKEVYFMYSPWEHPFPGQHPNTIWMLTREWMFSRAILKIHFFRSSKPFIEHNLFKLMKNCTIRLHIWSNTTIVFNLRFRSRKKWIFRENTQSRLRTPVWAHFAVDPPWNFLLVTSMGPVGSLWKSLVDWSYTCHSLFSTLQ